ncbi:MAG: hypothetical protein JWR74_1189 [Polaromonas sp.]|nr:hypothetical protein [Polaromonas sp.]
MKVALYIGDHAADGLMARLGWWVTRLVQKGAYGHVTHCEAIHAEHDDGSVTIASASLRDGGVRSKRVKLDPAHWWIVDVPQWDAARSIDFLAETVGMKYDLRGAVATVFLGSQDAARWFCNEHVAAPFLRSSGTFGPHHLTAICLSLGDDITDEFFRSRA